MNNTQHNHSYKRPHTSYIRCFSILLGIACIIGCSSSDTPEAADPANIDTAQPGTPSAALAQMNGNASTDIECAGASTDIQLAMLQLVNDFRASAQNCGSTSFPAADPLRWNSKLEAAAEAHSEDMSSQDFFSHTGSDGLSVSSRVTTVGYDWSRVGENIAGGQPNTDDASDAWIGSSGHCANLMNKDYTEFAVSCRSRSGSNLTHYWTMVLATPR